MATGYARSRHDRKAKFGLPERLLFRYYWCDVPTEHPYEVSKLPGFQDVWLKCSAIISLCHLKWGLYRIFTDGLLYFGNVRIAYRELRSMTRPELAAFFGKHRFNTGLIKARGPALPLEIIPRDDRYLISEMACKSYGEFEAYPIVKTKMSEN